ncbi:hypothetical protein AVEN_126979-1 [Araneus ventricosus]|uniref:Uncharacterized protein n=1 Tax=Araneus ventricosus TaxID=182803 RepID=A0A4Y2U045_ARAVE|nr:hypothetical protein AVEN_190790-1 [Araneus ventricosus]GBO05344.1 hypothetical protein AVEN_126979-1 [Araneus ventricosus]
MHRADSRSSIQFLSTWRNIGDKTSTGIVNKLRIYCSHNDINLQWIPSHVDLFFNDLVDELAKEGSAEPLGNRGLLTYSDIFSKVRPITTGPGGSHLFMTGINENILGLP